MMMKKKNKLLPSHSSSPSSSSSSSSYSSFDHTMCTSKKATAGCLTGILRRILCSRGLPTHPSDQMRDVDSVLKYEEDDHEFKAKQKIEADSVATAATTTNRSAPGIVARLMGLESTVEMEMPTESSATLLSRSRSMNSVECYGECDRMQGIHRRVKSTLSVREVPGFLLLENEKFLVLSFEGDEFESKRREREMGSAELKLRRKSKENRREKVSSEKILSDEEEKQSRRLVNEMSLSKNDGKLREVTNILPLSSFVVASGNKCIDSEAEKFEEVPNGKKLKRRRRKKKKKTCCNCTTKKTELECNSEDSSPVSVLDFDRHVPGSEVDSSGVSFSSRRKLSPELENGQHFLLRYDGSLMMEQRKVKANEGQKHEGSKRKEKQRQEYIDIWDEICRKVGDELVGSNHIWKEGDWESTSEDFESEIFDHLVNELIDQLLVG